MNQSFMRCLFVKSRNKYAALFSNLLFINFYRAKALVVATARLVFLHLIEVINIVVTVIILWNFFSWVSTLDEGGYSSDTYFGFTVLFTALFTIMGFGLFTRHITEPIQTTYIECLKECGILESVLKLSQEGK